MIRLFFLLALTIKIVFAVDQTQIIEFKEGGFYLGEKLLLEIGDHEGEIHLANLTFCDFKLRRNKKLKSLDIISGQLKHKGRIHESGDIYNIGWEKPDQKEEQKEISPINLPEDIESIDIEFKEGAFFLGQNQLLKIGDHKDHIKLGNLIFCNFKLRDDKKHLKTIEIISGQLKDRNEKYKAGDFYNLGWERSNENEEQNETSPKTVPVNFTFIHNEGFSSYQEEINETDRKFLEELGIESIQKEGDWTIIRHKDGKMTKVLSYNSFIGDKSFNISQGKLTIFKN